MSVNALIIDDSECFRLLLRAHLELLGCRVAGEASTPRQGLQLFGAINPQLVLLDPMIPDDPGFKTISLLRKIRSNSPKTAVLLITAKQKSSIEFDEMRTKLQRIFPELTPARIPPPSVETRFGSTS